MKAAARAIGLFSVVPVPAQPTLTPRDAAAAFRLFPLVGAVLGAAAALPLAAIAHWAPHGLLVGAVLAVALLAIATRGLHLDGLADTADGLGSRAAPERAREIMAASDIGPFGVVTLVLVLLADVAALATLHDVWAPVAALGLAAATGRVAALAAAHPRMPNARPGGFGSLVTGAAPTAVLAGWVIADLAAGGLVAWACGADVAGWVVGQAVALAVCGAFLAHVRRRIGGVTGDVYGALVELGTVLTLAAFALAG